MKLGTERPMSKNIYIFAISSAIILSIILTALFFGYHYRVKNLSNRDPALPAADNQPDITINRVHQTATRDGITEWSLDADSVEFIDNKKEAVLKKLSVTFFLKNNQKIYLTADQGSVNTESNDIEVTGNVIVKNRNIVMKTDQLTYHHAQRRLITKIPIAINQMTSSLSAESMMFDLNTNKAFFKGRVEGCFSESALSY